MALFERILSWIQGKPKKGLVEEISERLLNEKQKNGSISKNSYNVAAKELTKSLFEGELPLNEIKNSLHSASEINKENLRGTNRRSSSGEFRVVYSDGDDESKGKVCLFKEDKLLFRKAVKRPNCCEVSNNGIVVCADWVGWDSETTGRVLIFDINGNEIFNKKLRANIGDCGISDDGNFAVFETFYSDKGHSESYYIVDVAQKLVIKRAKKKIDFPNYFFDLPSRLLIIKSKGIKQVIQF